MTILKYTKANHSSKEKSEVKCTLCVSSQSEVTNFTKILTIQQLVQVGTGLVQNDCQGCIILMFCLLCFTSKKSFQLNFRRKNT